jgi:hypothetical protein
MSGALPFGYAGEPGTCLWCGRKLRHRRVMATDADQGNPTYKVEGAQFATIVADRAGPYQDDTFDTLGCGYRFGLRMAELGRRLAPRTTT